MVNNFLKKIWVLKYETSRREQNNCKRKKGIRCEKKIAIQAYNENNTTQLTTEKEESIVKVVGTG